MVGGVRRGRKVIVHFGPGYFYPGNIGREVRPNECHLSFEIDADKHEMFLKTKENYLKSDPGDAIKYSFSRNRSAGDTRLKSNSADEVHIKDVFTDRRAGQPEEPLLAEAKRILKPGGAVIVTHTLGVDFFPKEKLLEIARKFGFETEILFEARDASRLSPQQLGVLKQHLGSKFAELVVKNPGLIIEQNSFLAKLTKK